MKKKILKVLFVLATIDVLDIISKGQVVGWMKRYHSDAYNELMDDSYDDSYLAKYNLIRIRTKMIDMVAKLWEWMLP